MARAGFDGGALIRAGEEFVIAVDVAVFRLAGVGSSQAFGISVGAGEFFGNCLRVVGEVNAVIVTLRHFPAIQPHDFGGAGEKRLRFDEHPAEFVIKFSGKRAYKFQVLKLVVAYGYESGII